ncbi:trans-resveratrol di-O-methyltransferase-like [Andrographis paniculata]|uniref:trans-resveratrol di-O-methyltransferase-like n=1 Tax=Andrographis paniculata TaxID=175694 RepID=UPI0021E74631|nr:trans-resveratrol di-O-methyltransferase-like [Andrographis paniculata]
MFDLYLFILTDDYRIAEELMFCLPVDQQNYIHYILCMLGKMQISNSKSEMVLIGANDAEGSSGELAGARLDILNPILGLAKSMSLRCAVQLRIPDIVHRHGEPAPLRHLAAALGIHSVNKVRCLHLLLRILTQSGYLTEVRISPAAGGDEEEDKVGYLLTPSSRILLAGDRFSQAPFVLSFLSPVLMNPWESLSRWLEDDEASAATATPFDMANGRSRWDGESSSEQAAAAAFDLLFKEAMASDARLVGDVLVRDRRGLLEGLESMVDVGGSTGELAKAIAAAFPEMRCTVLDLPHVVGGLVGSGNLNFVAGDMFEFIPPASAVLMKWILHCWNDGESLKILKKCKEAIRGHGKGEKVMIIETVVDESSANQNQRAYETQLFFDMEDLVLVPGRERTQKEWAKLFLDAGFSGYKIFPILGFRCLIEVYP